MTESGSGLQPELPDGWTRKRVGDVATVVRGVSYKKEQTSSEPRDGCIPLLRSGNIRDELDLGRKLVYVPEEVVRGDQRLAVGDIVVSVSNSRELVGKAAPLHSAWEGTFGAFLGVVRPIDGAVDPAFLAAFFRSPGYRQEIMSLSAATSNIANIRKGHLLDLDIALPSLDEQRLIVESIERRLADICLGSSMLRDVTDRLGEFHASLREAACLGTLLHSRRHRSGGGDGPSPLPDGWAWETLAKVAADGPRSITDGPFGSNLKSSHYTDSGPRVIRLQNVGDGVFLDARAHISQSHFETLRAHQALPGDVVLASLGDDLPRACVVPDWLGPAIVKADCPRVRPAPEVNPYFLAECLNSRPIRRQAAAVVHGMGRSRLKLADARKLKVPVPPLEEQNEIIARLSEIQSGARRLEKERDEVLTASEAIRRALLRDAMRGSLALPRQEREPQRQRTSLG